MLTVKLLCMSAVLKLTRDGWINNICLIYNFKEVNDLILVIMYSDKLQTMEKIFLIYENGAWNTAVIADYTDKETYQQICIKLKFIFMKHEYTDKEKSLRLEEMMRRDAKFMLAIQET